MEVKESFPRVYTERSGAEGGEPLLLMHGWGSNASLMRPLAQAFSSSCQILNVDLPGHGHSPDPPEPWGVPEHAALVAHLIEKNLAPPVTVLGHSNGGRIALFMASHDRYRKLIKRLVLISPSGVTPHRGFRYHLRRNTATLLKAPFTILPKPLREFGLDWLRHSLVWRLLGSSDYRSLQGVMRETFVRTVNYHLDDRLGHIQVPTLIFWGDQDSAVSRRQIEILEARIPDAGVVVLDGAGHYGYLDDPDTVVAATHHFLAEGREIVASSLDADTE